MRNANKNVTKKSTKLADKEGANTMSEDSKAARELEDAATSARDTELALDTIEVDEDFNARKSYDPVKVDNLATDIRKRGLITPLTVARAGKGYRLISGFTRYRALKQLEKTMRKEGAKQPAMWPVRVLKLDNEVDAYIANSIENIMRSDLTTYEVADRAVLLEEKFQLKAGKIASEFGYDRKYVNNLMRCYRQLHPDILEAWSNPNHPSHEACTWSWLSSIAAKDAEAQLKLWHQRIGLEDEDEDDADEGGKGKSKGKKEDAGKVIRKPTVTKLQEAIAHVEASEESDDYKAGAVAALLFAMGSKPTIPRVYNPKKPTLTDEPTEDEAPRAEA